MRRHQGRWSPRLRPSYSRLLVVFVTLVAIAIVSIGMGKLQGDGAVMRVALDRVPEERVVEFGHEAPQMVMVLPVPAPDAADFISPEPDLPATEPVRLAAAQPGTRPAPARPSTVRPDANGILPIDYSLPQGVSSQQGGVGVAKTIAAEGGVATGLTIFLIGGSLIEVDRGELVSALSQLGASDKASRLPPAGDTGRLSLDRVRTAGLDLRYDAVNDRLVLRP